MVPTSSFFLWQEFVCLLLTQMGTAVTRAIARGYEGSLERGFKINLKLGILIFLGGLALTVYYAINENYVLAISFALAGIFIPITSSSASL